MVTDGDFILFQLTRDLKENALEVVPDTIVVPLVAIKAFRFVGTVLKSSCEKSNCPTRPLSFVLTLSLRFFPQPRPVLSFR